MRLHRNLCFAVIDGLLLIFNEGEYADKVIQKLLKRDKRWGSRDRAFVAETTYDIVRWKRLYAEIAEVKEPFDRDKIWRIFAVWAVLRGYTLPDWKYFEETPVRRIKGKFDELTKTRKFKESIPDWMDELGVKELGEENATYLAGDCAEADVARSIAATALKKFGKIDAVIPNAGIGMYGSILDYSDEQITSMLRTNIDASIHIIRAALPSMINAATGDIVITASVAGFHAAANQAIYSGTKHAQVGFAGSLDRELRSKGVRVALVCPAGVETEFALGFGRTAGEDKLKTYLRPEDVAFQITTIMSQPRTVRSHIWTLWSMGQDS